MAMVVPSGVLTSTGRRKISSPGPLITVLGEPRFTSVNHLNELPIESANLASYSKSDSGKIGILQTSQNETQNLFI